MDPLEYKWKLLCGGMQGTSLHLYTTLFAKWQAKANK